MTIASTELLTVPEVMARLKFSRGKVYELIRTKRLVSFKEGKSRRIPESALRAYISARLEEAG